MAKTAADILAIARKEVGYSRYDDPEQGTKYGRWYAKKMGSPYFGTTGVPYCAMFVSWCLDQGGVSCLGCPTAGCTSGLLVPARRAGKLIRVEDCKAGDLALFNWTSAGFYASEADHVGFVTANSKGSKTVSTIEGNVSGAVMTRTRSYSCLCSLKVFYHQQGTPTNKTVLSIGIRAGRLCFKRDPWFLRSVLTRWTFSENEAPFNVHHCLMEQIIRTGKHA